MPNQLNYPIQLVDNTYQRPSRLTAADLNIIKTQNRQIIFGTNDNDVVELWIYNSDGSFAGHLNLGPTSTALSLTSLIDNTGATEVMNIDLKAAAQSMSLAPGRYVMVGNFFRNEVGSEESYQLYISDISDDRTELQLTPITPTEQTYQDIFEFVTPSVPKQYAKGLVDELFNKAVEAPTSSSLSLEKLSAEMPDEVDRMAYAGIGDLFVIIHQKLVTRSYPVILDLMAQDVFNLQVQRIELENYIEKAFTSVIYNMMQSGEIDPRFALE